MSAIDEIKAMPGVTAAVAAAPHMGWPERGLTIYGSPDVGIVCYHDPADIREAQFTSWTYSQFHYCPQAKWADWVTLARRIIAIDDKLSSNAMPASQS